MGGMVMGEWKDRQRKYCIVQTNCKHSERGYGKLPLSDVCTCRGFLPKTCKFEKVDSKTFLHKLIKGFVNGGFGNPWKPPINRFYGTQ
jgi:hypothetical protein